MSALGSPRITVFPTDEIAARTLAARIATLVASKPDLVIGLPTGRTPIRLYGELASLSEQGKVDFSRVTTFNLDEFLGIAADHPGSFRTFMNAHLFGRVNLQPDRIHFLNGVTPDPAADCTRYEDEIAAAGGIDLLLLGLGTNGHVGFNEPARSLEARTHRVRLTSDTRRANAALFGGDAEVVPAEALSMGMATILHARSIVLIATGASKASVVERMVRGPITPELPASFLQMHRDCELILDQAAAAKLPVRPA
jgi:glucosamine-6-phosphate deaminase